MEGIRVGGTGNLRGETTTVDHCNNSFCFHQKSGSSISIVSAIFLTLFSRKSGQKVFLTHPTIICAPTHPFPTSQSHRIGTARTRASPTRRGRAQSRLVLLVVVLVVVQRPPQRRQRRQWVETIWRRRRFWQQRRRQRSQQQELSPQQQPQWQGQGRRDAAGSGARRVRPPAGRAARMGQYSNQHVRGGRRIPADGRLHRGHGQTPGMWVRQRQRVGTNH